MTIYLACTVRGNRDGLSTARHLCDLLQQAGHDVVTTHLLADDADEAESALGERQIYERDIRWLDACDLLVAEASGSSYGVGFETGYVLGRADRTNQQVLLLYDKTREARISRLIAGNVHPRCTVYGYADDGDLEHVVKDFLGRIPSADQRPRTLASDHGAP
jgi:nucleoside 2-deoxyribosyltransferase